MIYFVFDLVRLNLGFLLNKLIRYDRAVETRQGRKRSLPYVVAQPQVEEPRVDI